MLPLETATLPSGTNLAYTDSWSALAPADRPSKFTTLVALHGVGFNSAVWTPLLASLPPHLRLIAYNQRSYTGSLAAFEGKEAGGVDATAQYLVDLMEFLGFVVEELGAKEKEAGGVVLLGWSKGTVLPISLLSYLHSSSSSPLSSTSSYLSHLPPSLPHFSLLTTHLRSILLFEPPGSAFGRAPTSDYTTAMAAVSPPNSATPTEFAEAFAGWIGQYSPPSSSHDQTPVEKLPASGLAALSPDVLAASWEPGQVAHGFSWRLSASAGEVQALSKLALAPEGREVAVPVGLVYGGRTVGYCLDAAELVKGWWGVEGNEGEGEGKKRTAVKVIEGTNHFAFVHKPEEFVKVVLELVEELGA
ncbi:hypothetical protein JCM8547_002479 [Rhodosporidiobolus lusitaniae]